MSKYLPYLARRWPILKLQWGEGGGDVPLALQHEFHILVTNFFTIETIDNYDLNRFDILINFGSPKIKQKETPLASRLPPCLICLCMHIQSHLLCWIPCSPLGLLTKKLATVCLGPTLEIPNFHIQQMKRIEKVRVSFYLRFPVGKLDSDKFPAKKCTVRNKVDYTFLNFYILLSLL